MLKDLQDQLRLARDAVSVVAERVQTRCEQHEQDSLAAAELAAANELADQVGEVRRATAVELQQARAESAAHEDRATGLSGELAEAKAHMERVTEERVALAGQLGGARGRVDQLERVVAEEQARSERRAELAGEQIAALERDLEVSRRSCEELTAAKLEAIATAKAKENALREQASAHAHSLRELEVSVAATEASLRCVEGEKEQARTDAQAARAETRATTRTLTELRGELASVTNERDGVVEAHAAAGASLSTAKAELGRCAAESLRVAARIADLEAECGERSASTEAAERALEAARGETKTLAGELGEVRSGLREANLARDKVAGDLTNSQRVLAGVHNQVRALQADAASARGAAQDEATRQREQLEATGAALGEELARLTEELASAGEELTSTRGELAGAREELASEREELASTRGELVGAREELVGMAGALEHEQRVSREVRMRCGVMEVQVEGQEARVAERDRALADEQLQCGELRKENVAHLATVDELRTTLESARALAREDFAARLGDLQELQQAEVARLQKAIANQQRVLEATKMRLEASAAEHTVLKQEVRGVLILNILHEASVYIKNGGGGALST